MCRAVAFDGIGGADNVASVIHCITRLRFYLKDESLADDAAVTESADVIDVARAGGQYQVVIGPKVAQVYNAVVKQLPQGSGEDAPEEEERERPTTFVGWMKYGFSSLIGVITGSMIPIIGVLAASGILKGILALLTYYKVVGDETDTYKFIDAMSSSMFYFLPIIVGFTAARRLGANPIVVAIIGGVLCFPTLVAMSNPKGESYHVIAQLGKTVFNADFFGIPVALPTGREGMAYTSTIFPIIVAAWLASRLEPWLERWIPAVIQSMFVPLLEIFIVSALILVVFGPIVMFFSGFIANGINSIITFNYVFAGLVIGALYQSLVIFGLHWAVIPIIAAQLASSGGGESRINAIVSATMIAQGAGALAIWVKSKNPRIRQLAGPATISAMCGVTGIKPTYGRVSRYGMIAFASSLDQAGVFARSAADCALLLSAMAGFDERDATSLRAPADDLATVPAADWGGSADMPLKGLRVGVPDEFLGESLAPAVRDAVRAALARFEALGATMVPVSLPHTELSIPAYYVIAPAEASSNLARFDGVRYGHRSADAADLKSLYMNSRAEGFGPEVKRRIMIGTYVLSHGYYDAYYRKAQQLRRMIADDFTRVFADVDVIAGPVSPETAWPIGQQTDDPVRNYLADIYTLPASLAGLPGLSLPCGFDAAGLPVGLQLVGPALTEARLLSIGHTYQQHTDWHLRRPGQGA